MSTWVLVIHQSRRLLSALAGCSSTGRKGSKHRLALRAVVYQGKKEPLPEANDGGRPIPRSGPNDGRTCGTAFLPHGIAPSDLMLEILKRKNGQDLLIPKLQSSTSLTATTRPETNRTSTRFSSDLPARRTHSLKFEHSIFTLGRWALDFSALSPNSRSPRCLMTSQYHPAEGHFIQCM